MVKEKTVQQTGRALATLVAIILWLTGIIVALAVGFGMTSGALNIPWLPDVLTMAAGWIVVILTILGLVLAIIDRATG
jgi:hypothetical protein